MPCWRQAIDPCKMKILITNKEQNLVNKWIKELLTQGYSPDEMIKIFRMAKQMNDEYKKQRLKDNDKSKNI